MPEQKVDIKASRKLIAAATPGGLLSGSCIIIGTWKTDYALRVETSDPTEGFQSVASARPLHKNYGDQKTRRQPSSTAKNGEREGSHETLDMRRGEKESNAPTIPSTIESSNDCAPFGFIPVPLTLETFVSFLKNPQASAPIAGLPLNVDSLRVIPEVLTTYCQDAGEESTESKTSLFVVVSATPLKAAVDFIVAARDPETGWPAALTELEEAEIFVAKWEKSCEILANEKIAAVRDWQLAYKELEEARQELGIFRRDLMVATLGMPSSEDADDEDRLDWLCKIAVEGEVAQAELKRRNEPVKCSRRTGTKHHSWTYCQPPCGRTLHENMKFCPDCGRKLEWL